MSENKTQENVTQAAVKKADPRKPKLPLNKLYKFAGGEVAQDPKGGHLKKDAKACTVRATAFVANAKYGYKVRPVGAGDAYGYVEESQLAKL